MGYINNVTLKNKYKKLKLKYNRSFHETLSNVFDRRLTHLNSYMNQSRFGLARLFDNSSTVNN
jgi:hypothetical protein